MCGYCMEDTILNNLRDQVRGKLKFKYLGGILYDYYLRESPDFISSLDTLRRSFAQKKLDFFSVVSRLTLVFRGLEILLEQGFASPVYQKLLKNKLYRDAIAAACCDERKKEFASATKGLDIEHLGLLYDAETYFSEDRSRKLITLENVLPSCCNLLKHYISWWLMPFPLYTAEVSDIESQHKEFTKEDNYRLELLSRALYFSILLVGSCSAGKKILLAISERATTRVPFFDGIDLWLQRVAALKLYDLEGFDLFLERLQTVFPTSCFYICQMRGFSDEQKQRLLDEINHRDISNTYYQWLTVPARRFSSF